MSPTTRAALEGQFLAAIDMLENAMRACPEALWSEGREWTSFWYIAYHTLWWLDCYLGESLEAYRPPSPFGMEELDPEGVLPPATCSRDQLLSWVAHCRRKCAGAVDALTDETEGAAAGFPRLGLSRLELLLYNLRHVQHHAAQLNLLLRQRTDSAPRWVTRGRAD